jgi:L-alanine-DL-glutamate epimerase-like enolase superfamily enzyme
MKIVDIRETAVPIKSEISNAYIDFSQMTVSVLAIITDVWREEKRVVGFGFNSNGRYAPSGLLRDRFIPRLKSAKPESIVDSTGENLDPFRIWQVLMKNEKPGGHGERSVAVGVLDMAVWDVVAKGRRRSPVPIVGRQVSEWKLRAQGVCLCRRRLLPA